MNAIILAALLVFITGTQLSSLNRDLKKLRQLSVALLGCETVALALLVFKDPFAESVTAWVGLAMFALINAGVVVAAMICPSSPST